jgi:uncharacterized protein
MSEPALIDGLKFAHEARRLAGELDLAAMPRLQDNLFDAAGRVHYELVGGRDRHAHPIIDVKVRGTIPLVCQRCLERLDYALDRSSRLVLVGDENELPDVAEEDPESESIPTAEVTNVADLVEQEVLLGLPLAPMHAQPCTPAAQAPEEKADSPFAVLRALQRKD